MTGHIPTDHSLPNIRKREIITTKNTKPSLHTTKSYRMDRKFFS